MVVNGYYWDSVEVRQSRCTTRVYASTSFIHIIIIHNEPPRDENVKSENDLLNRDLDEFFPASEPYMHIYPKKSMIVVFRNWT